MKKIGSVFVTALVFAVSFVHSVFGVDKSNETDINWSINQTGKGYPVDKAGHKKIAHKLTNMEKNKNLTVEAGKMENLGEGKFKTEDLGKVEDMDKKITKGNVKFENLEQGQVSGKINNLEGNTTSTDLKLNDLEKKR
jgi:hypothetical protein